jgi:phospholipid/cholesterol/gamma-HCH transport system permease protein
MFSGRVGANNTAELATMVVTEQVDALRALAIEPVAHLAVPRVLAMLTMMSALYMVGCAFALAGGMLTAQGLIGVDFAVFWNSFAEYVLLSDFINGWVKCSAFGLLVGVLSCAFGFGASGGAAGVGRAVNACVVASALGIFVLDAFITMLWR